MGRFATTVPLYEKFRPPYPADFFRAVSRRLGLRKEHRLSDLGTGPGLLALGFAPYVRRIGGVDQEPGVLGAARKASPGGAQDSLRLGSGAEALPRALGRFDVVRIGRLCH